MFTLARATGKKAEVCKLRYCRFRVSATTRHRGPEHRGGLPLGWWNKRSPTPARRSNECVRCFDLCNDRLLVVLSAALIAISRAPQSCTMIRFESRARSSHRLAASPNQAGSVDLATVNSLSNAWYSPLGHISAAAAASDDSASVLTAIGSYFMRASKGRCAQGAPLRARDCKRFAK